MSAPDRGLLYTTLRGEGHGELEDRKSVFLSHAAPVRTEEEALAFVKARQKEFSDATHNVWAFRLGADTVARYSDDGEPQGTAGMPILEVLRHENLTDCVCVVTRYFGGILLGTGGLIRAYQGTVKFALETLPTAERLVTVPLRVTIEHRYVTQFLRLLPQYRASISESNFGMDAEYVLAIPRDAIPALTKDLTELTSGSVLVEPPEED